MKLKTPVSVIFQILIQNINKNSNTELSTKLIVSVYSKQKHAVAVIFLFHMKKKPEFDHILEYRRQYQEMSSEELI